MTCSVIAFTCAASVKFVTMFVTSMILMLCGEKAEDGTDKTCEGGNKEAAGHEEHKYADLIDKVLHSKVMEELKALPSEIKESLILHVERQSLVVAGVLVAIGAVVLLLGCLWIHWCHSEYEYIPVSQLEEVEKRLYYAKPSHGRHKPHSHSRHKRSHDHHNHHHHSKREPEHEGTKVVHRKTHTHVANGGHAMAEGSG